MAEIITLGEFADCDTCQDVSKRVSGKTFDVEGPGKVGVIYDCDNKKCKRKNNIHVSYIIRKETYGEQ